MVSRIKPVIFALHAFAAASTLLAQTPCTPVTFTADQDHQNMMDQLGIKTLRPGWSGNDNAPNHANYDESKANPYPNVPDPLTMNDGQKVTTPEMWWKDRRPQIVDMYSKYVYGFVPANVPKVTWTVTAVDHELIGFTPVIAKDLIGEVDNSRLPRDQRQDSHDRGYTRQCHRARARAHGVYPRRFSQSQRAARRGTRQNQRRNEGTLASSRIHRLKMSSHSIPRGSPSRRARSFSARS